MKGEKMRLLEIMSGVVFHTLATWNSENRQCLGAAIISAADLLGIRTQIPREWILPYCQIGSGTRQESNKAASYKFEHENQILLWGWRSSNRTILLGHQTGKRKKFPSSIFLLPLMLPVVRSKLTKLEGFSLNMRSKKGFNIEGQFLNYQDRAISDLLVLLYSSPSISFLLASVCCTPWLKYNLLFIYYFI